MRIVSRRRITRRVRIVFTIRCGCGRTHRLIRGQTVCCGCGRTFRA